MLVPQLAWSILIPDHLFSRSIETCHDRPHPYPLQTVRQIRMTLTNWHYLIPSHRIPSDLISSDPKAKFTTSTATSNRLIQEYNSSQGPIHIQSRVSPFLSMTSALHPELQLRAVGAFVHAPAHLAFWASLDLQHWTIQNSSCTSKSAGSHEAEVTQSSVLGSANELSCTQAVRQASSHELHLASQGLSALFCTVRSYRRQQTESKVPTLALACPRRQSEHRAREMARRSMRSAPCSRNVDLHGLRWWRTSSLEPRA